MNNLFNRCINRLLSSVDDDQDFPTLSGKTSPAHESDSANETIKKIRNIERRFRKYPPTRSVIFELLTLKDSQQLAEKAKQQEKHFASFLVNPTLLRAAARIQIDFPDDFIGDDVHGIEEKLRTGHSSLRTKYWRQIIEAAMEDDLGRGRPMLNQAVGPWGCNPLAHAIKKGAQLVESVPPEPELAFPRKAEEKAKPESLSTIQLTLIWVAIIFCVQAIKRFIE